MASLKKSPDKNSPTNDDETLATTEFLDAPLKWPKKNEEVQASPFPFETEKSEENAFEERKEPFTLLNSDHGTVLTNTTLHRQKAKKVMLRKDNLRLKTVQIAESDILKNPGLVPTEEQILSI